MFLFIGGLLSFVIFILLTRQNYEWLRMTSFDLIGIGMSLYFILFATCLWKAKPIHYDNFTHWATIVKFLFLYNHLPGISDKLISYNTYPIGSSIYLYYASKIGGYHDGMLLVGQFIIIAACLYSLFATLRDDRRLLTSSLLFASFGLFNLFNVAIRTNNLLVDFLLPLLALAGVAGIFAYRGHLLRQSFYVSLILSVLMLVKTSATIFVLAVLVIYFYVVFRDNFHKKKFIQRLLIILLTGVTPFLMYQTWVIHVKSTFKGLENTKHEVKSTTLSEILDGNLSKEMLKICHNFFQWICSWSSFSSLSFALIFLCFLIFILLFGIKFKKWKFNFFVFFLSVFYTIVYYIGLLLMYLLAMPTDEAVRLAGFERYASSILIFISGILTIFIVRELDKNFYEQNLNKRGYTSFKNFRNKRIYQLVSYTCLLYFAGSSLSEVNGMNFQLKQNQPLLSQKIVNLIKNKKTTKGKILVVSADKADVESYYLSYLSKYELWNNNVDVRYDFIMSGDDFKKTIRNYDDILLLDDHYTFVKMSSIVLHKDLKPGFYSSKYLLDQNGQSLAK